MRGFGSLLRAVGRTASRIGGDAAYDIARTTHDIYDVNATAADLESTRRRRCCQGRIPGPARHVRGNPWQRPHVGNGSAAA